MTVPFSLALDLLVAFLLVMTIGYAVVLNRRLKGLREHKAEMEKLSTVFAQATARAEESIGRLKSSVAELQSSSERAQALRDDLAFLVERGGTVADRLEEKVRAARDKSPEGARATAPVKGKPAKETIADLAAQADAEPPDPARELLKALRATR